MMVPLRAAAAAAAVVAFVTPTQHHKYQTKKIRRRHSAAQYSSIYYNVNSVLSMLVQITATGAVNSMLKMFTW